MNSNSKMAPREPPIPVLTLSGDHVPCVAWTSGLSSKEQKQAKVVGYHFEVRL